MMRRTLFSALAAGALLLAFAAPSVLAAEPGTKQTTSKSAKAKAHTKSQHKGKAHHAATAQTDATTRRPDAAGPLS